LIRPEQGIAGFHPGTRYFPNDIGNVWRYEVIDSTRLRKDYVTVRVTGTTSVQNLEAKIWTYQYPYKTDTSYVVATDTSVIVFNSDRYSTAMTYVLPLQSGRTWKGAWIFDDYVIGKSDSVALSNGQKRWGYNIKETGTSPNYLRTRNEWFVPYYGTALLHRYEYNNGPADHKYWQLVACDLK
jgi:hypothetical protein